MSEDIIKDYLNSRKEDCIDDIISLLRSINCLYKDFFEEISSEGPDNVAELGIRLDAINRFGHCIMEKITAEDFGF